MLNDKARASCNDQGDHKEPDSESLKLIGFKISMPLFNAQILPPQSNLGSAVLMKTAIAH